MDVNYIVVYVTIFCRNFRGNKLGKEMKSQQHYSATRILISPEGSKIAVSTIEDVVTFYQLQLLFCVKEYEDDQFQ
jgi:hypothetical protein